MLQIVRPPEFVKRYYNRFMWNVPPVANEIYLTFDDGPVPGPTEFVLDCLSDFKAKATFFCVGNNVRKNSSIYQRIFEEGHTVGNHTMNHVNGWMSTTSNYIEEVQQASQFISSGLFRPPYGRIRKQQSDILLNDYKIVMWDVLSYDFNNKISPEQCLNNVMNNTKSGSIIVFHDSEKAFANLKHALPECLKHLSNEGFQFKSL